MTISYKLTTPVEANAREKIGVTRSDHTTDYGRLNALLIIMHTAIIILLYVNITHVLQLQCTWNAPLKALYTLTSRYRY